MTNCLLRLCHIAPSGPVHFVHLLPLKKILDGTFLSVRSLLGLAPSAMPSSVRPGAALPSIWLSHPFRRSAAQHPFRRSVAQHPFRRSVVGDPAFGDPACLACALMSPICLSG